MLQKIFDHYTEDLFVLEASPFSPDEEFSSVSPHLEAEKAKKQRFLTSHYVGNEPSDMNENVDHDRTNLMMTNAHLRPSQISASSLSLSCDPPTDSKFEQYSLLKILSHIIPGYVFASYQQSEVLQSNFFHIGGNSMLAIELLWCIRSQLQVKSEQNTSFFTLTCSSVIVFTSLYCTY